MATDAMKECSALAQPFNKVSADMRAGSTLWEELMNRGAKMQKHFETASSSMYAFFEVLQKLADLASGARGATRDIGALLTKLAMRHRSIAKSLSQVSNAIGDEFLKGFTVLSEDTRRLCASLERDHDRDMKKWKSDLRKSNEGLLKLSKAASKKKAHSRDKEEMEDRLEEAMQVSLEQYKDYESCEQQYLRLAMLQERQHYCTMLQGLKPIVAAEVALLDETYHLQGLLSDTDILTENPGTLPEASVLVVEGLQLDINRLFREIQSRSNAVEDAMRESEEKKRMRTSFLSLVSGDSGNSAQDAGEGSLSPNSAGTASSLSLVQDCMRMEPDGSSRSEDPTPDSGYHPAAESLRGASANPIALAGCGSRLSPLPPPPPSLLSQQDSVSDNTICDIDDLPPPPPPDTDYLPPPPPPKAQESPSPNLPAASTSSSAAWKLPCATTATAPTSAPVSVKPQIRERASSLSLSADPSPILEEVPSPDLPSPPTDFSGAWQPPGAAGAPTLASLPVNVKPKILERSSSMIVRPTSTFTEHKRLFPPMPPPKTVRRGKPPVPPPNTTVRSFSTAPSVPARAPENIYDIPRNLRQAPPVAERPASAIFIPSLQQALAARSACESPEPYSSTHDTRWHGAAQPANEPLYATVGAPLPVPTKPHSASDLRSSYHLRTSQTDLYHPSFSSVHAVATLPRSRSVIGTSSLEHYGRETPLGRPRANTTHHNPVSWQGATQSVDV